MKTIKYEPMGGQTITSAAMEAVALAKKQKCKVGFTFNSIALEATPKTSANTLVATFHDKMSSSGQAYRMSKKGQAGAEIRRGEIAARQVLVDHLLNPAVVDGSIQRGLGSVMSLLRELADPVDDIGVTKDLKSLVAKLEAAGYEENENVGHAPKWFCSRVRLGRYVVGQAINCMKIGLGPHPALTHKFCAEYEAMPK